MSVRRAAVCILLALLSVCGCAHKRVVTTQRNPPRVDPPPSPPTVPYHLHLNGIGGYRSIDEYMLLGLEEGGLHGEIQAYDWTGADVGLGALLASGRHEQQAHEVARMILAAAREQPGRRITVTTHSAGAGIIAWALAELPDDVTVDSIIMLAPALSPTYDLTPALRHVTGKLYVFYSPYDVAVLGVGTKMLGTVDGVRTEAAGKVGFTKPTRADPRQYAKLVQVPYDSAWMRLGNIGDHIGPMSRPFAREILAPVLLRGTLPPPRAKEDPLKLPPPLPTSTPAPSTTAPAAGP